MSSLFGTDGIRGPANIGPLSPASILAIGQALGKVARRRNDHPRIVIGKDTRASGYMIESALVAGLTSIGVDPLLLGPLPTPGTSFMTRSMRADFGIMITASHNPYSDNGLKFFGPLGCKLCDAMQDQIERAYTQIMAGAVCQGRLNTPMGKASRVAHAHARYVEAVKKTVPRNLRLNGLNVVIDCAHGAGYRAAPEVLKAFGAQTEVIHNTPNGFNINARCGATDTRALAAKVVAQGADIGLALDGDADRIIGCDETGRVIDGDQILAAIATAYHRKGMLRGNTVAATIISNLALDSYLNRLGIAVRRSAVGDRALAAEMRTHGLSLGAESSGHLILSDFACTGDGLAGALQILTLLAETGQRASTVFGCFKPFPQSHRAVPIDTAQFDMATPAIEALLRAHQQRLSSKERMIVRKSGTEPIVRILFEGPDAQANETRASALAAAMTQESLRENRLLAAA